MDGLQPEVGVAVEFGELEGGPEDLGGGLGLAGADGGCAVGAGLAAGTNNQMDGPAGAGLTGDDAAGAELEVVGVRPEGEERGENWAAWSCRKKRVGFAVEWTTSRRRETCNLIGYKGSAARRESRWWAPLGAGYAGRSV
jgi:hypothetical protein